MNTMKQQTEPITLAAPGYERLAAVLQSAFNQAAHGKGKERHANALPFHEQPMQQIARSRGLGFILGQADKKSQEGQGMLERGNTEACVRELLGAIVYLAGAVVFIQDQQAKADPVLKHLNAYLETEGFVKGTGAPLRRATDWPHVSHDARSAAAGLGIHVSVVAADLAGANDNEACCNGGLRNHIRCKGCQEGCGHG